MRPMLAVGVQDDAIRFPVYASPKLDGVRGLVLDGRLVSRSLKPIPNRHVSERFGARLLSGLDGELILGSPTAKDVFRVTGAATSREEWTPDVKFYAFDDFGARGGFAERYLALVARLERVANPHVIVLEQKTIRDRRELLAYEAEKLEAGYEGLILRSPNGPYKHGRSTANEGTMLKLKRFVDSEAVILGVEEELENTNAKKTNELGRGARSHHQAGMVPKGRMGALRVRDLASGVEFSIGSGFDAREREWFWTHQVEAIGRLVKYKSFAIGVKDSPRFPVYLGGREEWDL